MEIKKIFFVAVMSFVFSSAECTQTTATDQSQTVFDLPADTPGLMSQKQQKEVCGVDKECVHVIVPGTNAAICYLHGYTYGYVEGFGTTREYVKARNEKEKQQDALNAAINCDGNIYFPADGTQPTTPEAVEYSCANVDNREDSPITEWYMKMFGWIPEDDTQAGAMYDHVTRLRIGFTKNNQCVPIIILHHDLIGNELIGIFMPNGKLTKKQSFWYFFRQIASNPVGRMLLYRILIEIRREATDISCIPRSSPYIEDMRKYNRKLCIEWSSVGNFAYRPAGNPRLGFGENAAISFNSEIFMIQPCIRSSCIGPQINGNSVAIVRQDTSCAIGIFHELNHWFHLLRYPSRYIDERNAKNGTVQLNGKDANGTPQISIGGLYWTYDNNGPEFVNKLGVSALPWLTNSKHINFEEVRNILGSSADGCADYKEGDDLSENLYRASINYPLRFGHNASGYWEDADVITKVERVCRQAINNHGWRYDLIRAEGVLPFSGDKVMNLIRGIGGCVHVDSGVESGDS